MNASHALNAYRTVDAHGAVTDASPHRLIEMLLDGALGRLASARGAMERGDIARQGELLGKAISIIDSLRASLDGSRGGDLAVRLGELYDYMEQRLVDAGRAADPAGIDEVRSLLGEIRTGWTSIPAEQR